jgi:hypothetical protein
MYEKGINFEVRWEKWEPETIVGDYHRCRSCPFFCTAREKVAAYDGLIF